GRLADLQDCRRRCRPARVPFHPFLTFSSISTFFSFLTFSSISTFFSFSTFSPGVAGAAGRLAGVSPQVSPGSSPVPKLLANNNVKLDHLKDWSVSAFKCTKQMLLEKMGEVEVMQEATGSLVTQACQLTSQATMKLCELASEADSSMQGFNLRHSHATVLVLDRNHRNALRAALAAVEATQIELLRDTQRKYEDIIRLGRAFCSHFHHVVQTQRALGDAFAELAVKAPELQDEFNVNSETQRALVAAGDTLMAALNFFTSSVNTLVNKTMVDTLDTYRMYEQARLEYDAYRGEYEAVSLQAQQALDLAASSPTRDKTVKVMQKQLVLLHRAVSAYFGGNQEALELALKQFSIKVQSPNSQPPSWLEGITGMH
ncbi:PREDICTED: arfaptin-2-like, partial [Priapulus caudatus]|uniref:Arfaptin-2-like n=1 Tax=Priapulus caudatus TaxID=37621 RepID=A0ABM1EZ93_PRICU